MFTIKSILNLDPLLQSKCLKRITHIWYAFVAFVNGSRLTLSMPNYSITSDIWQCV